MSRKSKVDADTVELISALGAEVVALRVVLGAVIDTLAVVMPAGFRREVLAEAREQMQSIVDCAPQGKASKAEVFGHMAEMIDVICEEPGSLGDGGSVH
jgi:hypothetical protein